MRFFFLIKNLQGQRHKIAKTWMRQKKAVSLFIIPYMTVSLTSRRNVNIDCSFVCDIISLQNSRKRKKARKFWKMKCGKKPLT